jgi:hypothetical protein
MMWKDMLDFVIAVFRRTSRRAKNASPQRHRGLTEVRRENLGVSLCQLCVSVVKSLLIQTETAISDLTDDLFKNQALFQGDKYVNLR